MPGVLDPDHHRTNLLPGFDAKRALFPHGVEGVVDQVGPHLAELATPRFDPG
jgi:hypothetical protein